MAYKIGSSWLREFFGICTKKGWEGEHGLLNIDANSGMGPNRSVGAIPVNLMDGKNMLGISFFPFNLRERTAHAFWDCLGETVFRPSNELLISLYLSRLRPILSEDKDFLRKLDSWYKSEHDSFHDVPLDIFDRLDISVHAPDFYYEGNKAPIYYARFEMNGRRVRKTVGLYDQVSADRPNGYGDANLGTLLTESNPTGKGLLKDRINVDGYGRDLVLETRHKPIRVLRKLFGVFDYIVQSFREGVYDHVHDEPYDF